MPIRIMAQSLMALVLLFATPVYAVNIERCSMVSEGLTKVISFTARTAAGTEVTLKGLITAPDGEGPFPAIVMLPGAEGLVTPYCYRAVVERLVGWGYITLIPAGTTARDSKGKNHLQYSFLDQVNYAHGGAAVLLTMRQVDPARISVWGHSRGGLSVLHGAASEEKSFGTIFRAAVAAAPQCPANATPPSIPLLLLIGSEDLSVSVDACSDLAAHLEGAPGFEFLLIPNAGHAYWAPSTPQYNRTGAELAEKRLEAFLRSALEIRP